MVSRRAQQAMDLLCNLNDTYQVVPIDPFDKRSPHYPLLQKLQGNILKGHDRDHLVLILFRFNSLDNDGHLIPDIVRQIKERIRDHAKEITSARVQLDEWKRYHEDRVPGALFANFFLTAKGYRALGLDVDNEEKGFDERFRQGMQHSKEDLCDPEFGRWEDRYQQNEGKEIHGMILLADDDQNFLGREVRRIFEELRIGDNNTALAEAIGFEHGIVRRDNTGEPLEHFGFRDGISNPMFLTTDKAKIDKYGGSTEWSPWAPLCLALVQDPFLPEDATAAGSYFVYRKLAQHVKKFEAIVRNLAMALNLDSSSEENLEQIRARILGRFRDGTPATLMSKPYGIYADENYNNFSYGEDLGTKCPLHAHARKANPREYLNPNEYDDPRAYLGDLLTGRIVRRGITYGIRQEYQEARGLDSLPDNDVGLLFMCFQGNIERQFEHIQKSFFNNVNFPKNDTGLDPVIGQTSEKTPPPQNWALEWGKNGYTCSQAMGGCVTLRGGEYFFAPSLTFLENITNL